MLWKTGITKVREFLLQIFLRVCCLLHLCDVKITLLKYIYELCYGVFSLV